MKAATETKPSPTAPATPASAAKPSAYLPRADGFRDTMESIVIAFIFAFVFRAFIVEAFVIPTGSMAPTLFGVHGKHRCAACRYPYVYGIKEDTTVGGQTYHGTLSNAVVARCPNCGWADEGNILNDATRRNPVVPDAGDRILVLKWPYDIGGDFLGPRRWDVVVFKNPEDGDQNFIKRLIGMPGEVLEIIDGDIYSAKVSSPLSPALVQELSRIHEPRADRTSRTLTPALREELDRALKIQRKTGLAQDSLWLLHYDHDYPPDPATQSRNPHAPEWTPVPRPDGKTPWEAASPCVIFDPIDDEEHFLKLTGKPIRDGYGYNMSDGDVNVSDVKLKFVFTPLESQAETTLVLRRGDEEFRARLALDGAASLERRTNRAAPAQLASAKTTAMAVGKAVTVEFQRLDYRVSLLLDGQELLATADRDYNPDVQRLRNTPEGQAPPAAIAISGKKGAMEIRHLVVYRDVYYRGGPTALNAAGMSQRSVDPIAGKHWWGTANNPILLRPNPGEYFCCGDNSPQSKDSRLWFLDGSTRVPRVVERIMADRGGYQLGTVPADQMIGRAFFVYWPGGLRLSEYGPSVIPNVGRMRIIR